MSTAGMTEGSDPYLWLEEVTGAEAVDWVGERNADTMARYCRTARFAELHKEIREVLEADDRIPFVRRRGDLLYSFWQDANHPRGLWRRTTLAEYRTAAPRWEVLVDVDALAAAEGENWVWKSATVSRPGYRRALVTLSRGGADATVVRELDMDTHEFVPGGFTLPEAKTTVDWIDADRIYVATDFGGGSLTASGYPRIVKEWRRGTPLDEAVSVFEGRSDDLSVTGTHDPTEGHQRDIIQRGIDFYRSQWFLRAKGELVRIEVPEDAVPSIHRDWLLVKTRSPWEVNGSRYATGSLLIMSFERFLRGERDFEVLFEPDPRTSLESWAWTREHLLLCVLRDVRTELRQARHTGGSWRSVPLTDVPTGVTAEVFATDPDSGDEYLLAASGYLTPATFGRGEVGGPIEILKQAPALMDTEGMSVEQCFATSVDGTRIPYFVVHPRGRRGGPALLTGYGGFEVSLRPWYLGVEGRAWVARGGTYVVANVRGGGEYGPEWHTQVLKSRRHRVYEDFTAVAEDLVNRGVTTPAGLGIEGSSNGGLLTGVMLTRRPDLFAAVVSQAPLLDLKRYPHLLAGSSWLAEYGDPDSPEEWAYISRYSPYHNVHSGRRYPPTLFVTSARDDRVHPAHARKMTARMAAHGHDVHYFEAVDGGHGTDVDNDQLAFRTALVFEFLWTHLAGIEAG